MPPVDSYTSSKMLLLRPEPREHPSVSAHDRRRGRLRNSHTNITCLENGEDYVFLTNSWHQPLRLISPWTTLHAFGGWKSMQV